VARDGDVENELHRFVEGRYLALRRTAYLLCGDWHRAEDLVQGSLVKVVLAARRRRIENLDAYSRQVLLRLFLEENRLLWRKRERTWAEPVENGSAAQAPDSETRIAVLSALRGLPPRQRAAVVFRYWEDRSVEETAGLLGVAPGTVKSQCAKALAALRVVLGDDRLHFDMGAEGVWQ
jgi:RNA polymerase sigma-70 factor (sigma-E family)